MSVVGKYRYQMLSPSEHNRVPVLVDIILVGRTKIITVHSGMWVDNRMDKHLTFRLHVPVTPLTAPATGGSGSSSRSDTVIGPVKPDKGETCLFAALIVQNAICGRTAYVMQASLQLRPMLVIVTMHASQCMLQHRGHHSLRHDAPADASQLCPAWHPPYSM